MTGPWGGGERELPVPDGEPGGPRGLQPPGPGAEPGDRLPGPYGGPPHDGGIPDGEPGAPAGPPAPGSDGRTGDRRDRATTGGDGGAGGGGGTGDGGRGTGPWRPPARTDEEPTPEPPEHMRTAWVLWLAATGFALVGALVNALTSRLADLPSSTRDMFTDAAEQAGDAASVETLFRAATGLAAVVAILAAAVTVWLAFRLRAGKGWARMLLNIVGVFLVVDAVAVLVGVFSGSLEAGSRGEAATFLVLSLQILAGLCAATAVWRQHSEDATTFLAGSARGRD